MVTPGIRDSNRLAELLAPYEPVRRIGSRPNPLYIARQTDGNGEKPQLFVAECLLDAVGAAEHGATTGFVTHARRVATLASANVPRVRELTVRGNDVVVFGNFIDGERLVEVWEEMPLEVSLRVLVDVLSGLGALHNLRDMQQRPMRLAHGEVSPATILFGLDGTARLLHSIARLVPGAPRDEGSVAYLAPEVHAGEAWDAGADVFGVGVLLWEALAGTRLFPDGDVGAMVTRTRGGVGPPTVRDSAPWARGLVGVATKALSASPDDRWPTAAAMAAEIRKAAGLHLAPAAEAATLARSLMGARVKARRDELEGIAEPAAHTERIALVTGARGRDPAAPAPSEEPESVTTEVEMRAPFPDIVDPELPPAPPSTGLAAQSASASHPDSFRDMRPAVDEGVDITFSSLGPSTAISEPTPASVTTSSIAFLRRGGRRRTALLVGAGLVGAGAVAFASWHGGHRDRELPPQARAAETVVAADAPVAAPPPSAAAESSASASTAPTTSSPPPAPRAPAHPHKAASPSKPKGAAPSLRGKGGPTQPTHPPPSKSRPRPTPQPGGL